MQKQSSEALLWASLWCAVMGCCVGLLQVEARTLEEVEQVLACHGEGPGRVTRVMLDNMTTVKEDGTLDVSLLRQAVQLVDGRLETEVSAIGTEPRLPMRQRAAELRVALACPGARAF